MITKSRIVENENQALTLEEVKVYADINNNHDDKALERIITAAIEFVESRTGKALLISTWEVYYDVPDVENVMPLDTLNVNSISEVSYFDRDNTETVIDSSNYRLFRDRIYFNDNYCAPYRYNLRDFQSVKATVIAGYGNDFTSLPFQIKAAISQLSAYWVDTAGMTASDVDFKNIPYSVESKILPFVRKRHWV